MFVCLFILSFARSLVGCLAFFFGCVHLLRALTMKLLSPFTPCASEKKLGNTIDPSFENVWVQTPSKSAWEILMSGDTVDSWKNPVAVELDSKKSRVICRGVFLNGFPEPSTYPWLPKEILVYYSGGSGALDPPRRLLLSAGWKELKSQNSICKMLLFVAEIHPTRQKLGSSSQYPLGGAGLSSTAFCRIRAQLFCRFIVSQSGGLTSPRSFSISMPLGVACLLHVSALDLRRLDAVVCFYIFCSLEIWFEEDNYLTYNFDRKCWCDA